MDDTLKAVTLGLCALLMIHSGLERRARNDATRQVSQSFHNSGVIRSTVASRGELGMFTNDVWSVDVYGDRQISENLPFQVVPRGGWRGHIRHLRLHLTRFALAGLTLDRLDADIPSVTYDLGHALYHDRLVLRGAGVGPATVTVGAKAMEAFILAKYDQTIKHARVTIQNGKLTVAGRLSFLGGETPFDASGTLIARGGRFVDLSNVELNVNGAPATSDFVDLALQNINPVLDVERDLHLDGFFTITSVDLSDSAMSIRGRATVPTVARRTNSPIGDARR